MLQRQGAQWAGTKSEAWEGMWERKRARRQRHALLAAVGCPTRARPAPPGASSNSSLFVPLHLPPPAPCALRGPMSRLRSLCRC